MHNKPVQRTQDDEMQDEYSHASGLDSKAEGLPDTTVQEYKDDNNPNRVLRQFGAIPNNRPLVYGEQDFNVNLQSAYHAIREAREAYSRLPQKIRDVYPLDEIHRHIGTPEFAQAVKDALQPAKPEEKPAET